MKYRVELTAKAESDVDGVLRWFAERHAVAAGGRWLGNLMARIDTLETRPGRCSMADEAAELGEELREITFGRRRGTYRILFVIEGETVRILHIRHAARSAAGRADLN